MNLGVVWYLDIVFFLQTKGEKPPMDNVPSAETDLLP